MDTPKTLLEAVRHYSDLDNCEQAMRRARWGSGPIKCPECGSTNIGEIKTRRLLRCRDCRRQIYTKRGTIFEDSPLGLDKWMSAIYAVAVIPEVTSVALGEALNVQQHTAWRMLTMIRAAMEV